MDNGFKPKILICVECAEEFVFTTAAQQYFAEKGYTEEPKRCKHCYMHFKRGKRNATTEISDTANEEHESVESDITDNP